MKKVFQSKVCSVEGDCCRAAIASIFGKELNEVPPLYPDHHQAHEIMKYFREQGFEPTFYNRREEGDYSPTGKRYPSIEEVAKYDGGVGGYFYASVNSQTFEGCSHAVIVDINLNIVHDPNPNGLALKLSPKDVVEIIVVGKWHINLEGEFVDENNNKI